VTRSAGVDSGTAPRNQSRDAASCADSKPSRLLMSAGPRSGCCCRRIGVAAVAVAAVAAAATASTAIAAATATGTVRPATPMMQRGSPG
jgi:hypothetical protein